MTEEIKSVGANLPEKDWFKFDGDKFVPCDKDGNIIRKPPVKTLRDEMAMAALVMCSPDSSDTVASYAYAIADAMLEARKKGCE